MDLKITTVLSFCFHLSINPFLSIVYQLLREPKVNYYPFESRNQFLKTTSLGKVFFNSKVFYLFEKTYPHARRQLKD